MLSVGDGLCFLEGFLIRLRSFYDLVLDTVALGMDYCVLTAQGSAVSTFRLLVFVALKKQMRTTAALGMGACGWCSIAAGCNIFASPDWRCAQECGLLLSLSIPLMKNQGWVKR